jgi:hypothetical protein
LREVNESGETYGWDRVGDSWTGTIRKRAHQFRYRCVYEPDNEQPYAVYVQYRRSRDTVSAAYVQVLILISILEENSFEEIIHQISDIFNNEASGLGFHDIKLKYEYDNQKGEFVWIMYNDTRMTLWEIVTDRSYSVPNLIGESNDVNKLLHFFNQDDNFKNYSHLVEPSYGKGFVEEVWDRKRVQFHSSFSDARNKYIGSNKDHFDSPTKLYRYVLTDPMFYIRFTTNGRTSFIPRYCSIIIELCFILNYQRTVLLD